MPSKTRNKQAGRLLKMWRLDEGLSPEQLAWAIAASQRQHISGRTIRRIEEQGTIPTPRVGSALARHFGKTLTEVWHRELIRA